LNEKIIGHFATSVFNSLFIESSFGVAWEGGTLNHRNMLL